MSEFFCPGSKLLREPKPEIILCPKCSLEIEIWSDETKGTCPQCQQQIMRNIDMGCLEWCKFSEACVGTETYNKYKKNRAKT